MRTKALLVGALLSLTSVGYAHEHPNCCANYFLKNGYFFFKQCGTYYPVYQDPRFCKLISHRARYRHYQQWHHEYPNNKLHCRFYPAEGHYRMYTNAGLSVEHYFPVKDRVW